MKRRRFVSVLGRIAAFLAGSRELWRARGAAAEELDDSRRAALRAAVDEIIPAEGSLPSAGGAGALAYFERRRSEDAAFAKALDGVLDALDRLCRESSGTAFGAASPELRGSALRALEAAQPHPFAELRDTIYEAYYTDPDVQRLIGYDFRASPQPTAPLAEFDEASLARVRAMAPFYRRAPR